MIVLSVGDGFAALSNIRTALRGSCSVRSRAAAATLVIAAVNGLTAPAGAAGGRFSFHSIEFAPAEQRLPAAQAFLRTAASPGTPLPLAIAAIRRANAACRKRPQRDGTILCRYSAAVNASADNMPLGDVTWTIVIRPTADGRVAATNVSRERVGR
jgi:hypothetical protein